MDFRLLVSSGSVTDSTIERFDPENMGSLSRQMAELLRVQLCTRSALHLTHYGRFSDG